MNNSCAQVRFGITASGLAGGPVGATAPCVLGNCPLYSVSELPANPFFRFDYRRQVRVPCAASVRPMNLQLHRSPIGLAARRTQSNHTTSTPCASARGVRQPQSHGRPKRVRRHLRRQLVQQKIGLLGPL